MRYVCWARGKAPFLAVAILLVACSKRLVTEVNPALNVRGVLPAPNSPVILSQANGLRTQSGIVNLTGTCDDSVVNGTPNVTTILPSSGSVTSSSCVAGVLTATIDFGAATTAAPIVTKDQLEKTAIVRTTNGFGESSEYVFTTYQLPVPSTWATSFAPGTAGAPAGSFARANFDGDFMYIAGGTRLYIYNVGNPLAPTYAGSVLIPGADMFDVVADQGLAIAVGATNIWTFDVTDAANPVMLGTLAVAGMNGYTTLEIVGDHVFLNLPSSPGVLVNIDLSNPAAPTFAPAGNLTLQDLSFDITKHGNYLYVSNINSQSVSVVNATNPDLPTVVRHIPSSGDSNADPLTVIPLAFPRKVVVSNDRLYVGHWGTGWGYGDDPNLPAGVSSYDVSDPENPVHVFSYATWTGADLAAANGHFYLTHFYNEAFLMFDDNAIPTAQQWASTWGGIGGWSNGMHVHNGASFHLYGTAIGVHDLSAFNRALFDSALFD